MFSSHLNKSRLGRIVELENTQREVQQQVTYLVSTLGPGLFMHMYWECPDVVRHWNQTSLTLSDAFEVGIPLSQTLRRPFFIFVFVTDTNSMGGS